MRIVVTEYPKSGGSWLCFLLADALGMAAIDHDEYLSTRKTKQPAQFIDNNPPDDAGVELPPSCIIKSHALPKRMACSARFIHMIRDGRDVVVSRYHYDKELEVQNGVRQRFDEPWASYVPRVATEWSRYVEAWLAEGVVECRYEELLQDPVSRLHQLLCDLGIDCPMDRVAHAVAAHTKEKMRKSYDCLIHNTFVRKGVKGDWRNHFRPRDMASFNQAAGATLVRLGYEPNNAWIYAPAKADQERPPSNGGAKFRAFCWCGNERLESFSSRYLLCSACQTLRAAVMPKGTVTRVRDDENDLYGKRYWLAHQEEDLGLPNIVRRARHDLPERCLYWLHTLLCFCLPPGRLLELGSGHGGFVALARQAGYNATGVELSPWVVDFARQTFDVPMVCGPVEDQQIEPQSLDAVVLMDVLEDLPDPIGTLTRCLHLLKADGVFMVQTPRFPAGKTFQQIQDGEDAFLKPPREKEHLFLFSDESLQALFRRLGCEHQSVQPAIFADHDMCLIASRRPLTTHGGEAVTETLLRTASGRMVLALLDSELRYQRYKVLAQAAQDQLLDQSQQRIQELLASRWRKLGRKLGLTKPASFEHEALAAKGSEAMDALQESHDHQEAGKQLYRCYRTPAFTRTRPLISSPKQDQRELADALRTMGEAFRNQEVE